MKRIEITEGMNGYPKNLKRAYTNFKTYEEAERFARKYNGRVVRLHKKEGWSLWENQGCQYGLLERDLEGEFSDKMTFRKGSEDDFLENVRETIKDDIDSGISMTGLREKAERMQINLERIEDLEEGEVMITDQAMEYQETIKEKCISYSYDTHIYSIGVVIERTDVEEMVEERLDDITQEEHRGKMTTDYYVTEYSWTGERRLTARKREKGEQMKEDAIYTTEAVKGQGCGCPICKAWREDKDGIRTEYEKEGMTIREFISDNTDYEEEKKRITDTILQAADDEAE